MRCVVVIEKADGNYSAYVPDLPGCVATGPTLAAVEDEIRDAIRFHVEGLKAASTYRNRPVSPSTWRHGAEVEIDCVPQRLKRAGGDKRWQGSALPQAPADTS